MAVLNREQIKSLGLVTREDGMEEEQYQPHGVDLTLSNIHLLDDAGMLMIDGKVLSNTSPFFNLPETGLGRLHPGAYLISFNETVNLPPDIMAYLKPRSTLLRCGVTLETAVWDAGYHGSGQSLLVVHNPAGFYLAKGARVAQLVFHRLEQETEGYDGSYQGEGLPTDGLGLTVNQFLANHINRFYTEKLDMPDTTLRDLYSERDGGLPTGVRPVVIETGRKIVEENRDLYNRLAAYDSCSPGCDPGDCNCYEDNESIWDKMADEAHRDYVEDLILHRFEGETE